MCALKKEGLGCLPAQDRSAVLNLTMPGQRLAEAKVKYLSAGMGKIKTARKYENFIEFDATHKIFMDSNYKPVVRGIDSAIWNRLKAIPFTVTISDEQKDEKLPEKLRAEGEGILAWMVKGCLRWKEEGLGSPPEIEETSKGWREEMDPLKDFIEDCCVVQEDLYCKFSELWGVYKQWANDENKEEVLKQRTFTDRLTMLGFKSDKRYGSRARLGIGLKQED
ncbi:MAG: phage/plasmid primase, P4 family [Acidobacteria bacterium]|nr:phage/plasmid primase, P4 family [Acidobacteriota bacterium]